MSLQIKSLNHHIVDGGVARHLLIDLSLSVKPGECIALMGNSGSGKTTLLNVIAGLEPIQQGDIEIDDVVLSQLSEKQLSALRKQTIGIIFQQFNLLPSLSVKENIDHIHVTSSENDNHADEVLVQMKNLENGVNALVSIVETFMPPQTAKNVTV